MTITLKPELEKYIQEQVEAGRYGSAEDLVAAAVARLMHDDRSGHFAPGELDELPAAGEADIERGDVLTLDDVREHFRWCDSLRRRQTHRKSEDDDHVWPLK